MLISAFAGKVGPGIRTYAYANELISMTQGRESYSTVFRSEISCRRKLPAMPTAAHKLHHEGDGGGEVASAWPVANSRTSRDAGLLPALGLRLGSSDGLSLSPCGGRAAGVSSGRSAALTRRRTAETAARAGV